MKNVVAFLLMICSSALAGFPPTTSQDSSDTSGVPTFFFEFPNFTGTHTGVTFSLGVNGIAGGGTNASSQTTNGVCYYNGTAITSGTGFEFVGGNVGIGTTSPSTALQVNGTVTATTFSGSGASLSSNTVPIAALAEGTAGDLLIGQGSSATAYEAMSGDCTISSSGVMSCNGFKYLESNSTVYGGTNSTLAITGTDSTVVGASAGASFSGGSNTIYGYSAGTVLTTGSNNTLVGASSTTAANNSIQSAIVGASASGASETATVGYSTSCNGGESTCLGWETGTSSSSNTYVIAIGNATVGAATGAVAIGSGLDNSNANTIAISPGDSGSHTASTSAANQFAIGDSRTDSYISTMCLGQGCAAVASPKTSVTLQLTGASGTNTAGSNFLIQPGNGTGTGASGNIQFQTAPGTAASPTPDTMQTVMQVNAADTVQLNYCSAGVPVTNSSGVISCINGTTGQILTANGSGNSPTWANNGSVTAPVFQTYTNAGVTTTGTISTSSVCITSVGSTAGIYPGMGIKDSSHNTALAPSNYVVGVPGTCSSGQIQMNAAASTAETTDTLVFGAMPSTTGTISTSSVCVTSMGATAYGVPVGAPVYDITHPTALGAVTVAGNPGTCSSGQVQLSADASTSETGDTLVFGQSFIPTGSPLYLRIRMVAGGGAGGGASGTAGLDTGGTGNPSIFGYSSSFITVLGGTGGSAGSSAGAGGAAATVTGISNISGFSVAGGYGQSGSQSTSSGTPGMGGGSGGASIFGSGGSGVSTPNAGATNSGSGGGGQYTAGAGDYSGAGGGSGAYAELIATSPTTSPVMVGAGGVESGGGANGGSGILIIEQMYQ